MFVFVAVLGKLSERHKIEHFPIQYLKGVHKNGVPGTFSGRIVIGYISQFNMPFSSSFPP